MASSGSTSISCAALAVIAMLGCSHKTEPTIVVTVAIEEDVGMDIPDSVNRLELTISDGQHEIPRSYVLVGPDDPERPGLAFNPKLNDEKDARIVSFEIALGTGVGELLTIKAALFLDDALVVSRIVTTDSVDAKPVWVDLKRSCILVECPTELEIQTCVPDLGCKVVPGQVPPADGGVSPDADVPDPDVMDLTKPNGPPCECNSYFPFCVGASWKYHVCDKDVGDCDSKAKSWAVADHTNLDGLEIPGFLLTRLTADNPTRKWLTLVDGRLVWLKDEALSLTWGPGSIKRFLPEKLRLDENYIGVGDAWSLAYDEISIDAEGFGGDLDKHDDHWEVISVQDVMPEIRKHGYTKTHFAELDILCHHRLDQVQGKPDALRDATYCFARHIGKIFEFTHGDAAEREWLLQADFPPDAILRGCQQIAYTPPN